MDRPTAKWGDDPARALAAALRYAGTGARSTREVRAFLSRRAVAPRIAQRILAECRLRGVLDDRACARLLVEHWARQGYAGAAIRLKLAAKGLEGPGIAPIVESMARASDDEARARLVAARHGSRGGRAGVVRRLAARGYEPDVIERVLSESSR